MSVVLHKLFGRQTGTWRTMALAAPGRCACRVSKMNEFDIKHGIVDEVTPPNVPLTAHYKKSFAYYTVRERLPVILSSVLDQLTKDKELIVKEYGGNQLVCDDLNEIQGGIAKLKCELQTNNTFSDLDGIVDKAEWNEFLKTLRVDNKDTYFSSTWFYTECYMYRRLQSLFETSTCLKEFDYFRKQKEHALTSAYDTIQFVTKNVNDFTENEANKSDNAALCEFFIKILKLSLWGNRYDLSISRQIAQTDANAFNALNSLEAFVLVDSSPSVWDCVLAGRDNPATIIDFVLDNAGYEFYTDLVLAHFLVHFGFAAKVRFHVKAIPWFVSDVMVHDFEWTLSTLQQHADKRIADFGRTLADYVKSGQFEIRPVDTFWTGPYEFCRMAAVKPQLYAQLAESHLAFFKGDLNHRKLLAERNWSYESTFEEVLQEFRPTNLCSLRTVKADLICELKPGVAEQIAKQDALWMQTGQYGVIHFAKAL